MSRFHTAAIFALGLSLTCVVGVRGQQPAPSAPAAPAAAPTAAAAAALTPADVTPFLGDWTLNLDSPMGPAAIALSIKADGTKVVGEISSDMMPKTPVTDISKAGQSLLLKYSFSFDGNPVPVVVTLAPAADKIGASLDFASGMFLMNGTATKAAK